MSDALADFEGLWSLMTPENQGRLLRAIIRDVTVQPDDEVVTALVPLTWPEAAE